MRQIRYSTGILKTPTGRYTIIGNVPVSCLEVYQTEQAAIDALLSAGVTRFQLSDCSWYVH